jgi:3'(2'), 5'-bisphosphate nucleotidase
VSSDHQVAAALAGEAADRLLELQERAVATRTTGWQLEYTGDEVAHDLLMGRLAHERPEDPVLSEEGADRRSERVGSSRAWIVDPLDGSAGFGAGSVEWAVHVALTTDGLPTGDVQPLTLPAEDRRPIVVTGRSKAWSVGRHLADALDADLASCGSSGFKTLLVLGGHADVYAHPSPLYEWDVCAPAAVAAAHGLAVCDPAGAELRFNRFDPVVPGLIVARPELIDATIAALR